MGLLVKRRVTLDLARRGTQATVPFSLGDRCAYEVIFTLRDGSEQVALPPGTSAAVTVRNGAGGTGCVDGCVIDHVNNNVIYTPTVDALSVEGNIECTLHLFDGDGGVIGAPTFIFAVSEGDKADTEGEVSKALVANPGWGIIADTENKAKEAAEAAAAAGNFAGQASKEVAAAQAEATEARAEADRARTEAELSKMWANGGILEDQPPSDINNSYYWAMVAAGERMSAETQVELAAAEVDKAKTEVQNAAAEVEKAKTEVQTAKAEAIKARMWAVGEKNTPGKTSPSDSNNAMYYSNKSRDYMNEAEKYTNMTLSLSVDREKHIYTVSLIRDGTVIGNPIEIDLPFEEVVVGGEYDDTSEELVLKLKDGGSVRIPVGDIISPDDVVRRMYHGSYDAVYTETSSGTVALIPVKVYSGEGAENTLVKRGSLGEIRVRSNPEFDDEAVPKRHVDEVADAFGKALVDLEERVTQNQPAPVKIVQNLGDSPTAVIAQKGVTDAIDGLALKGSASGKVIRIDDAAPGEYPVKAIVTGVDDPSSVNVRVAGKNFLSYPYLETTRTREGITFTDNGDGSITASGTATAGTYLMLNSIKPYKAHLGVDLSSYGKESATNGVITLSRNMVLNTTQGLLSLNFKTGDTVNETFYPQMEFGTVLTEYEPPKAAKVYTPNADGTVDGVLSLFPGMTLVTDNAYAILDVEYNRNITEELSRCVPTVEDYSVQNVVHQTRLIGKGKYISPIIQTEEAESSVLVQYNGGTVEHLKLSNKNKYPNKIAIDVASPAQHLYFNDIFITDDYAVGVRLPTGYYSQFNSCWVQGDIGIKIGKEDGSGWIGVLDFNACHFNNSVEAFKVYAKDTNTICLDKCSFEGSDLSIDNAGTLYVRNTYFGDQLNTGNKHGVLIARPGSKTYFDNCTIGVSIFTDGGEECLFDLRGDADSGRSIVFVTGGVLTISNNTVHETSPNAIYTSDSPENLIYIDFATFTPSKVNQNHNYIPFFIYDGFSPLRSKFPLRNYVCNGTMKSELGNAVMLSHSTANGATFDAAMTNPFGGSVLRANGTAKFFYKIPKHFVGQPMTLEFYLYTAAPTGLKISSTGLGGVYWGDAIHGYEDERRPIMYRIDVTPTAEAGCIEFNHSDSFNVYGVILKEHRYKEFLSCYEDSGELYCDEAPRTTDGATLGDIVGNIDLSSSGWKYTNGKWTPVFDTVTYSIEFSDGMAHIVGSDGTVKFLATTDTEAAEITLNLINCISSNANKFTPEGRGYGTTLITSENYAICNVVVTIDGIDVTNTVYNSETKTVTIPSVEGNIAITATAKYEVMPDISASHLCSWAYSVVNENFILGASNTEFALGILVRTKEDVTNNGLAEEDILKEGIFVRKDRHGNYLRPIPIPEGATKVTVEHTDGVAYKYTFIGVKGDTEDSKDITVLGEAKQEYNNTTFAAGEYDYILITCTTADGSNLTWNSSTEITTTSVIFSKAEEADLTGVE